MFAMFLYKIQYLELYWEKQEQVLILGLHPANERRRYNVTPSLIGWAQT